MVVARKKVPAAATTPAKPEATETVATPLVAGGASAKAPANKRKRLAKAFTRPLDKKLKKSALVRERFTFPESEYARLVAIKKQLAESGIDIKKSELLRAGLLLLDAVDEETLKAVLARVPPVG